MFVMIIVVIMKISIIMLIIIIITINIPRRSRIIAAVFRSFKLVKKGGEGIRQKPALVCTYAEQVCVDPKPFGYVDFWNGQTWWKRFGLVCVATEVSSQIWI